MKRRAPRVVSAVPLAAVLAACAGAPVPAGSPPSPGLHDRLEAVRAAHGMPALAGAVISSRTIEVAATGVRRVDRPEPAEIQDRFGLGSNAKAITATVAASLVESGLLSWDRALGDALPGVPMAAEYRGVTLRMILTHRAGLPPFTSDADFASARAYPGAGPAARARFLPVLLGPPPAAPPGTQTRYSNADFIVAAAIVERAGDLSWRELVRRRVFLPLATGGAFRGTPPARADEIRAWGHRFEGGRLVPSDPTAPAPALFEGAGGIAMSIAEYARFVQAHLRGLRGEEGFLGSQTVKELHRPDGRYALGWGVQEFAGERTSLHAGGNGEYYALVAIQPSRDRAVALLTNDGRDDVEGWCVALLEELLASRP